MGIFKDIFVNFENFLKVLQTYNYNYLISVVMIYVFFYIVNIVYIKRKYKKQIDKTLIELKKVNLEADLENKEKHIFYIYFILFIITSLLVITKDNLEIVLPLLSGLVLITLLSLKDQFNNLFLGLIFRSPVSTTIFEGMLFYFKDKPNEVCKVSKINPFKIIYKNEKTGQLHSIENKLLNETNIIHKVIKDLDYVEFKYLLDKEVDLDMYVKILRIKLNNFISKVDVSFREQRKNIFDIKSKYNSAPYLMPFFDIEVNYKSKDEIEVKIMITTYNYNYEKYLDDYLKYRPKMIKN